MNALEPLFARLARSTFRSRFRLGIKERQYCWDKGAEVICCRGCLAKWHQIPQGEPLSEAQQQYIVSVIHYWLVIQMNQQ
ncbi:DUF4186 family protein [Salmonella enterica]